MAETKNLVEAIIEGIQEKKGRAISVADLSSIDTAPCKYFVISSLRSRSSPTYTLSISNLGRFCGRPKSLAFNWKYLFTYPSFSRSEIQISKLGLCLSERRVGTFSIRRNLGRDFSEETISSSIRPTCHKRLDRLPEPFSIPLLYP